MKQLGQATIAGVVLLVLLVGAFAAGKVTSTFGLFDPGRGEYVESTDAVIESIRELATLTSVEVVEYTTVEKGNDRGWLNWAVGDRVTMFAVAKIGAGVDLQKLSSQDVDVDFEARSIEVRLPPAEVTYVALDNEATQVYDRDTGVFTGGDPRLEADARAAAETILKDAAIEQGLLAEAELETRRALRNFLTSLGFQVVRVEQD